MNRLRAIAASPVLEHVELALVSAILAFTFGLILLSTMARMINAGY